jgi:hypothetical protein
MGAGSLVVILSCVGEIKALFTYIVWLCIIIAYMHNTYIYISKSVDDNYED